MYRTKYRFEFPVLYNYPPSVVCDTVPVKSLDTRENVSTPLTGTVTVED